jgi:LPXTG-motif cell wall-anchored protein
MGDRLLLEEFVISKRGLVAAGALGLGTVLLAGTGAYACVIGDFSADSAVTCDTSGDAAQGLLTVHNDDSLTGAVVTVLQQGTQVASSHIAPAPGNKQQSSLTIPVPWQSGASYTVHVHSDQYNLDKDIPTTPTAPNTQCAKVVTPPPSKPSTPSQPSTPPASTPSSAPSPSQSSAAPAPAPSSSTGTQLAETGGGSNSTTMIGIAAALVVVGGGALFMVRRKAGARG